ncbi:hypothetical protein [Glaciecola sp. 1036]|uniref:hypothetical protein n=1 Tax=Alteromonadaceae TaxID=72275 RepID=UPI003D04C9C6
MELIKKTTIGLSLLASLFAATQVSAALVTTESNYFVRPGLRIGVGEFIDGLAVNGGTERTMLQGAVGYSESTVSLVDGTVKMYSEGYNTDQSLQTFGSFGERITITNGAGTDWNFGFAVEGYLDVYGGGPINDAASNPYLYYNVGIAVYRAGQVNYDNFVNNPDYDPVFFDVIDTIDYLDGNEGYSYIEAFAEVFGSITLESNYEQFDIFAYTNMIVDPALGSGVESYVSDFSHTATYGQSFDSGVEAFSSSGEFLGLRTPPPAPNNVSSPAGLGILGLGMACFMLGLKRRRC